MSGNGNFNVSRETQEKFNQLENLVRRWNPRINLVARSTLDSFQERHIQDGVDLVSVADQTGSWVDIGSGGGFPGLVVSILEGDRRDVKLVESDKRKCAFLNTARRELGLSCEVYNSRIEEVDIASASIVSARALAPLPRLLDLAHRLADSDGIFLFPKGENWRVEDVAARKTWRYDLEVVQDRAGTGSVILKIKNLMRVET